MRHAAALALYHIGDVISKVMNALEWGWLYPAYNWCMLKSADLDIGDRIWIPQQSDVAHGNVAESDND